MGGMGRFALVVTLDPGKGGFMREGGDQRRNLPQPKDVQLQVLDGELNRTDPIGIDLERHLDLIWSSFLCALGHIGQRDQMCLHWPEPDDAGAHIVLAKSRLQIILAVLSFDILDMGQLPAPICASLLTRLGLMPDGEKSFAFSRQLPVGILLIAVTSGGLMPLGGGRQLIAQPRGQRSIYLKVQQPGEVRVAKKGGALRLLQVLAIMAEKFLVRT